MSTPSFWSVEVKAGEPIKVSPKVDDDEEVDTMIHISHAILGEVKKEKGNERVLLYMKNGDQKIVLAHLFTESIPQVSFDVVIEKEVELSHNWKHGSVFLVGYTSEIPVEYDVTDSDEEQPFELLNADNGDRKAVAAAPKSNITKPDSSSKQKSVQLKDEKGDGGSDDDSDEDDEESDEDDESEGDDSEEGMSVDEDESDEEDDSESEDEETPKKAGKGSKRTNDSAIKTPVPAKKQKPATPQKTDGKKGGHTATPHPAKGAAKTSANGGTNTKPQTPKSGGVKCGSCDRAFGSEGALQSHTKAKHAGK